MVPQHTVDSTPSHTWEFRLIRIFIGEVPCAADEHVAAVPLPRAGHEVPPIVIRSPARALDVDVEPDLLHDPLLLGRLVEVGQDLVPGGYGLGLCWALRSQ